MDSEAGNRKRFTKCLGEMAKRGNLDGEAGNSMECKC